MCEEHQEYPQVEPSFSPKQNGLIKPEEACVDPPEYLRDLRDLSVVSVKLVKKATGSGFLEILR